MQVVILFLGGFTGAAAAAILGFLAMAMTGAGHGWTSPCRLSAFSLVTFPLIGIAAAMRTSNARLFLAGILVLAAIGSDVRLLGSTQAEGVQYFDRALNSIPEVVVSWLVIWICSQAIAAGIFIVTDRRLRQKPPGP